MSHTVKQVLFLVGKVGKCPLLPPPSLSCPERSEDECDVDTDCSLNGGQTPLCCVDNCGGRICLSQIRSKSHSRGTVNYFSHNYKVCQYISAWKNLTALFTKEIVVTVIEI